MAGYNRIIIVGNLTRDPELKQFPSGGAVCRLGLASNRQTKNKQTGATLQEVCYVDVDVWGLQAESCQKFLTKGRPVLVEGRLKFDSWQDAQGATRSKHSIVADRVVFLAQNAAGYAPEETVSGSFASDDQAAFETPSFTTSGTSEFAKIEQALSKKREEKKQQKPSSQKKDADIEGMVEFKDQPPFDEELPF